ncbi:MAG: ANTAR domain-containing protein [Lachnospiraceae bacterium]|nr:ANTAR domain-containing protein [Lachnospiraceae bacterium]
MVNVIIVFPKIEDGQKIRGVLTRLGIDVHTVCQSGNQVLQTLEDLDDGIIISAYRLSDMTCSNLKESLPTDFSLLVLASNSHSQEFFGEDILFLPMPFKAGELRDTIGDMSSIILRRRKKRREKPRERSAEDKAVILQAKEMLMRKNSYSEEDAHRYIQKVSMDSGRSLMETCQMLISML